MVAPVPANKPASAAPATRAFFDFVISRIPPIEFGLQPLLLLLTPSERVRMCVLGLSLPAGWGPSPGASRGTTGGAYPNQSPGDNSYYPCGLARNRAGSKHSNRQRGAILRILGDDNIWSGIRESNSRLHLGKVAYYHYTNPARTRTPQFTIIYSMAHTLEQGLERGELRKNKMKAGLRGIIRDLP